MDTTGQSQMIIEKKLTLEDLVESFLMDQNIASSSKATYSRGLQQFLAWLYETDKAGGMAILQREDILAYKDYLTSPRSTLVYFHNLDRIKAGAERYIDF